MIGRRGLRGTLCVPGDKSIAHRLIFLAAMSSGATRLRNVPAGHDIESSLQAMRALGAQIDETCDGEDRSLAITGWGDEPFPAVGKCDKPILLDCGNSGTSARFLLGLLTGCPHEAMLHGDDSLQKRPISRLTRILEGMGLSVISDEAWPLRVCGTDRPRSAHAILPVASAQMKTAVAFAGMQADGTTVIIEPASSRDHTERLAPIFDALIEESEEQIDEDAGRSIAHECPAHCIRIPGNQHLRAPEEELSIPGDISSAAYWIAAALAIPHSDLVIEDVCLNPTRLGFIRALQSMGAPISISQTRMLGNEPIGTIRVASCDDLMPCSTDSADSAQLIDEVPLLALLCCLAKGRSEIRNVGELRHKECDRLEASLEIVRACGSDAFSIERTDGTIDLVIEGNGTLGIADDGVYPSHGDHRIALTWAVVAAACAHPIAVADFDIIAVSYPSFLDEFTERLGFEPILSGE